MKVNSNPRGMSLLELVIAIAIVAILTSMAYPLYRDSIEKTRRMDAKTGLLELRQWLERNYALTNDYSKDPDGNTVTLPFVELPKEGMQKYYQAGFAQGSPDSHNYTLIAVPKSVQKNDKCGSFTLTNTGIRDIQQQKSGISKEQCW